METEHRMRNEERGCGNCKYYAELKEKREVGDNTIIYGYCFHSPYNMGKGFPVYLPDGTCKNWKKRSTQEMKEQQIQAVIDFAGTPAGEAMKKTVYKLEKAIEDHDEREEDIQIAKWEVFKLVIWQLTGLKFCFTRTDKYFGLCTENEEIYLFKTVRKKGTEK